MKKTVLLSMLLASQVALANNSGSQIFNSWDYNQYFTAMRTATDVGSNTWKIELDEDKFEFAKFNRTNIECDFNSKDLNIQWAVLDKNITLTKSCRVVERFGKAARTIYILDNKQDYDFLIEAFSSGKGKIPVEITKEDNEKVQYTTKDFNRRLHKYKNRTITNYDAWSLDAQSNTLVTKTDIKIGENKTVYDISFDKNSFKIKKSQFLNDESVPACQEHDELKEKIRFRSGDTIELKTQCLALNGILNSVTVIDDPTAVSALVTQLNTKKGFILRIKKLEMSITAKDFSEVNKNL